MHFKHIVRFLKALSYFAEKPWYSMFSKTYKVLRFSKRQNKLKINIDSASRMFDANMIISARLYLRDISPDTKFIRKQKCRML